MAKTYLPEREMCKRLNIAPRTAQRWRTTGEGPKYIRLGPRKIAYAEDDCDAYAAERTFAHRADELSREAR
jgi:predicted DNA-binding transcriptional regulator AlpA